MSKRKTLIITGAAKRIGKEIAIHFAKKKWNIGFHYNSSKHDALKLTKELEEYGVKIHSICCDLSKKKSYNNLIKSFSDKLGPPDLLINNASYFEYDSAEKINDTVWSNSIGVNLMAPIELSKNFYLHLKNNKKGLIINLLDQKIFNLNPDYFSYTISKIALEGATRLMALAFSPDLWVCGVAPGITLVSGKQSFENFKKSQESTPLGLSSSTKDIIKTIDYINNTVSITGTTIIVDGGQHLWPQKRDVQFEIEEK